MSTLKRSDQVNSSIASPVTGCQEFHAAMLNNDAMAQLQGLKQEIEAQKEQAEATVKGTQNRYGFAVVDDGREIFIPPDEMLKVLPGDRVGICIRPAPNRDRKAKGKAKEGRTVAEIERLVESPLDRFVGKIVTKGKAVFVEPDLHNLSRWLFIPPHARNGAKAGDLVECAVLRHPIKDGKPSAKVLQLLGNEQTPGIENRYCATRVGIPWEWSDKEAKILTDYAASRSPLDEQDRVDLTHLSFVSIDSARTVDIDDALYAEVTSSGWTLYVAIADPTAYLDGNDEVEKALLARGTSVYFHGDVIPMLPEGISRDLCALSEDTIRPALVCKMLVTDDGRVAEYEFMKASVRSRAKLTYAAVDRYVTGHNDELIAWSNPLEALVQAYRALRRYREEHELVMEDRQEYRWHLNESKQIETIDIGEKLASQHLVEECMIATNRSAASLLTSANATGPFVIHSGFRKDRLEEAREFLSRYQPELVDVKLETLEGYRQVLTTLSQPHPQPLRGMVNRLLTRAAFSIQSREHMGMGLPAYTNATSPLRKYLDFMAHRQIKAVLEKSTADKVAGGMLSKTSEMIARSREASQAAERWLTHNYLEKLKGEGTLHFSGVVCHITSAGFTVRLDETGLEGVVDLRQDPEKFSFDKWTASLTSTTRRFQLNQAVHLNYGGVAAGGDHVVVFTLDEHSGLKPPKEGSEG
jgi:VacB/RNase II family 3'-5' exoribonuclease